MQPLPFRCFGAMGMLAAAIVLSMAAVPARAQTPTTLTFGSLNILPATPMVAVGKTTDLSARATFNDGTIADYGGGSWDVLFSPQIDISTCPPLPSGAPVFSSQPVNRQAGGVVHEIWGNPQDVVADGTITTNTLSLALKCNQGGATLGSISATWTGSEYDGTFTVTKNSGNVIVRGITWTSSNPGVATIDANGIVTGVSVGVTTITATYGASCRKVGPQPPTPDWGCQGTTSGSGVLNVVPADDNDDSATIKSGYAIITPVSGAPASGIVAFATFGLKQVSGNTTQAGILPSSMTTNAVVAIETSTSLKRNFGVAIANPSGTAANLTFTLRGTDGIDIATATQTITPPIASGPLSLPNYSRLKPPGLRPADAA